jgi:hypothetical protein
MRSPIEALRLGLCAALLLLAGGAIAWGSSSSSSFTYALVPGGDPGPWPALLRPTGLVRAASAATADIIIAPAGAKADATWMDRVRQGGAILVLEGESDIASSLGIRASGQRVSARNAVDRRNARLPIIWEKAIEIARFDLPRDARIFTEERWTGAPLMAGLSAGSGAVLWLATGPGVRGHERYPYLLQSLRELGLRPPLRSGRLWAFFDSSYRTRADLDYFAERWRKAGIGALHVAAWHFYDRDLERDEYLRHLIDACHRRAIHVYAWLELPHVSEKFWIDHPEWREKTALGQDAHLDWRRLMNLSNRDCFRAVSVGVRDLIGRFDFDGINLAELYFESLEGASNAARFTPMNGDVRREFQAAAGFDPVILFQGKQAPDPARLARFLDYRADLARRMQQEWLAELDVIRLAKPYLDLVLTHVDDRFDTRMRDLIGADAARTLPLLDKHDFTFLIEDPATVWHLGPDRYGQIASRYRPLTPKPDRLAIDINIVDRYQDVYPTKQQTGVELFQLVNEAARSFSRVALYFENSIRPIDWDLLGAAGAAVARLERSGEQVLIDSPVPVGLSWNAPAAVDGRVWPVWDGHTVWLPAGVHTVEPSSISPPIRLLDLGAELQSAQNSGTGIEFTYRSASRAIAVFDRRPSQIVLDGKPADLPVVVNGSSVTLLLPRGEHQVKVAPPSPSL